ncbi:MAG: potassium channel protein [Sulfurovum sp.]|nr:MAG: potassium channel protein [Sulfurovum sp.]
MQMSRLKRAILNQALFLQYSKPYQKIKSFTKDVLTNTNNPYKKYLDIFIIFLIITSVAILIYEVKHPVPTWLDFYDLYFVTAVFAIEYLLRLWVHGDISEYIIKEYDEAKFLHRDFKLFAAIGEGIGMKIKYLLTPSALIDLLALFPAYRPFRVLRIFILFRVLKLLRYTKSINQFIEVLSNKRFELMTLLLILLFTIVTAGISLYVLEEKVNPRINTLFDAMYWALVTISTVGYGDITPVTHTGKVVSMLVIIGGIAMLSFATSVIVSAFSEKLSELKEGRVVEQINKSKSFLIICGYGQMTKMFLRQGKHTMENYVILEKDSTRVLEAQKDGYAVIQEDASRYKTLQKFNTQNAQITVLCLAANDIENIYISLNAKTVSKQIKVIARASSDKMAKKFKFAGVDYVLLPNIVANSMVHAAITQPAMYKAMKGILEGNNISHEIIAYNHIGIVGKSVGSLAFKKNKLLLVGIERGDDFLFNPSDDTLIQEHDVLLVLCQEISLEYFKNRLLENVDG